MGSVISKAANGAGVALGNAFVAPVKTIFGASCEGICSGTWDITCFIEHLCISSLLRLLMVSVLAYITLLFVYLLFQVGIIQCLCRSMCKMAWAACDTYWTALKDTSCFLWHKLKNTRRVYRRRFEDLEEGYSCSHHDSSSDEDYLDHRAKRRSVRERRKEHVRKSLYPMRDDSKGRRRRRSSRHRVRLTTREEVSLHVKPGRSRSSRALQLTNTTFNGRKKQLLKRHRIW